MSLHLVRMAVNPRALTAFAVQNAASDDDGGYALHLALRRRFGPAGPQPFRMMEARDGGLSLLGYSGEPDALRDAAALPALDETLDALFGAPDIRPMPATWQAGQRLGFDVRVRPVVRFGKSVKAERQASEAAQRPENWWARAGEVDAWVARLPPEGPPQISREEAYIGWLEGRLAGAATLERAELRQFRRVHTRRSTHGKPGRRGVEGPEAIIGGTLTIADPAAFAQALARGVGRHAAFGYGMLLLSPPGRPA